MRDATSAAPEGVARRARRWDAVRLGVAAVTGTGRPQSPPLSRFTLHVDFLAADHSAALDLAEAYTEALNLLRLELDGYTARVSADGDWTRPATVYCGAPGPDPSDVCTRRDGHPGPHRGPGVAPQWTDAQVPHTPDTIEGM